MLAPEALFGHPIGTQIASNWHTISWIIWILMQRMLKRNDEVEAEEEDDDAIRRKEDDYEDK